jgi:hypothetical protein
MPKKQKGPKKTYQNQLDKFVRDLDSNQDYNFGLIVSVNGGFANKYSENEVNTMQKLSYNSITVIKNSAQFVPLLIFL